MKKLLIFTIIITTIITAQTIHQIKSSPQYLWGEGQARRLRRADNLALKDLTSQISVLLSTRSQIVFGNVIDVESKDSKNLVLEGCAKNIDIKIHTYASKT